MISLVCEWLQRETRHKEKVRQGRAVGEGKGPTLQDAGDWGGFKATRTDRYGPGKIGDGNAGEKKNGGRNRVHLKRSKKGLGARGTRKKKTRKEEILIIPEVQRSRRQAGGKGDMEATRGPTFSMGLCWEIDHTVRQWWEEVGGHKRLEHGRTGDRHHCTADRSREGSATEEK